LPLEVPEETKETKEVKEIIMDTRETKEVEAKEKEAGDGFGIMKEISGVKERNIGGGSKRARLQVTVLP
jgi:hypothetical protein